MTALDFTNNRISDPNSGSVPADLIDLKLEYNFLPSIPRVLKFMNSVPSIDLTYNRIVSLQGTDFPDSVTGIDLGHNSITELNANSFPPNSGIRYLLLPNNPLSKISSSAFQNLPSLRELDLKYSKLTRLPLGLASLNNLVSIDVSGSDELVCTCMEKSLESKISSLLPDNVVGDCGQTSVYVFFTELSHDCSVV
ncbi:unnamed protein product [Candidula unifasciata]|uniref:Uncharacterized protein n=1 Tax=Candidula unifasciata TaxID=100452 RepID=A0A8S3ZAA1_9EUPU|nr:unnamed protein product [Candidula unifasciata]